MIGVRDGYEVAYCDWCYRPLRTVAEIAATRVEPLPGGSIVDNTTKPGRSATGPTEQLVHACADHAAELNAGAYPQTWPRLPESHRLPRASLWSRPEPRP